MTLARVKDDDDRNKSHGNMVDSRLDLTDQQSFANGTMVAARPRLPLELMEKVVRSLGPFAIAGDPASQKTLIMLSCVNRTIRHWALQTLYGVLVFPRHVKDFRKWYARSRSCQPPFQFAGYTTALFCALDDVSRLTTSSAGWDAELLRLLHYCGPQLTHLSLWRSESTALLRDPGQVRSGKRFGAEAPVYTWGENHVLLTHDTDDSQDNESRSPRQYTEQDLQDMPHWLRAEIATQGSDAVAKIHKAHLTPASMVVNKKANGCQPTHLSLVMTLPLYEHEDPKLFSVMTVFTRVEELDIFVPTTTQVHKVIWLLSSLVRSPLRRLRITTAFASFCLVTPPFVKTQKQKQEELEKRSNLFWSYPLGMTDDDEKTRVTPPSINLANCLAILLRDQDLIQPLLGVFQESKLDSLENFEQKLMSKFLVPVSSTTNLDIPFHGCTSNAETERIRIKITLGNQAVWGKLKDRLSDFYKRAQRISEGAWESLC